MRPRLLDLFCGAGGAAMGYHRAGFEVVGVDIEPQPNYPFEFHRIDALRVLRDGPISWYGRIDAIHASPPCQGYAGVTAWRGRRDEHPRLIAEVRRLLQRLLPPTGLPHVIENVPDARRELVHPLLLCGTGLGLPIRRHRYFELSWPWTPLLSPCQHQAGDYSFDHGGKQPESVYREAMGCDWMTVAESRQAIPPVYTELIGHQLMQHIEAENRAAA